MTATEARGCSPEQLSVLLMADWDTNLTGGGVATHAKILKENLSCLCRPTIVTIDWGATKVWYSLDDRVRIYHMRLLSPPALRKPFAKALFAWLLELPRSVLSLSRIARDAQVDVIHIHQMNSYMFAVYLLSRWKGIPYLVTFHGRDITEYAERPWLVRWVLRRLAAGASGFTAVSTNLAEIALARISYINNVKVIRNGIDATGTAQAIADAPLSIKTPAKYFLCIGRLYPLHHFALKGQDLAIRALARLIQTFPDTYLLIAGADDDKSHYEALAKEAGCDQRVRFLGSVPRTDLLRITAGAVAVIAASRQEGGGPTNAILEAGILGTPVLASDIPAHSECLRADVECLMFPSGQWEYLLSAMIRIMREHGLAGRLGKELRAAILERYSASTMAKAYYAAYLAALPASTRAPGQIHL